MKNTIYYRFGKRYRKLGRDEIIKRGAMQSWELGELQPITNADRQTIGGTPADFSNERDFYNLLLLTREEQFMTGGIPKNVRCYDNGGESFDRYTGTQVHSSLHCTLQRPWRMVSLYWDV